MSLSTDTLSTDLFIGGHWQTGTTGKRIDVMNPSNGQRLASVADVTPEDALRAVDAAAVKSCALVMN